MPPGELRRREYTLRWALILTLTFGAASVGLAAGRPMGPAETALRASCAADYRQLCADVGDEPSAVEACFRRKLGRVSPGCRDAAAEFSVEAKAERDALR